MHLDRSIDSRVAVSLRFELERNARETYEKSRSLRDRLELFPGFQGCAASSTLSREPESTYINVNSGIETTRRGRSVEISTRDLRQEHPFNRPIDTNSVRCAIGVA